MPELTKESRDAFLKEPGHLLRIGTINDDGTPLVVPIWYLYEDNQIFFTPRKTSGFRENLRRDQRVCLSIDEADLPYRKVTIRGTAECLYEPGEDDEWRDLYRKIAKRYIPDEAAETYIESTKDLPRALYAVSLTESTVTTWRMPVEGEPGSGIWPDRYNTTERTKKLLDQNLEMGPVEG